ncbi:MAG: DUF1588 domain-containing protein [Planctomycetota bacterium]
MDCHGELAQKGEVRFDTLMSLAQAERDALMTRAHEAIHFQDMPPSNKPQPTEAERQRLMGWLNDQLNDAGEQSVQDKIRYPHYGNVVDHDTLFSGEINALAYTPARRWLVSPQIYMNRVFDVLEMSDRDRREYASRSLYGVTNPFVLPDQSGVRDYALGGLTGGHLLIQLGNAKWIAGKQVFAAKHHGTNQGGLVFENPKDRWFPSAFGPESFKAMLASEQPATDEQLAAAITTQFELALQRPPTQRERDKYLALARDLVELGGNEEALRQICIAVLLESEFMYRLEFGGGETDLHGRRLLTPREAAFAISYALGDRGPDSALLQAAAEGRLETKADYEREVRRLLADKKYYRGAVDPSINGRHYQSNVVSHPKIIRFFREFFGYMAATKVFKDPPRAEGRYANLSRGTLGTAGWLIREADLIVTWHVENDQDVFENLLTSDRYFVYDQDSGERGERILANWELVWETLKDEPWQTEPKAVLEQHFDFIRRHLSLRSNKVDDRSGRDLVCYMRLFSESFGIGKTPYPRGPWTHGYFINHSIFYSLPPSPRYGRYHVNWKSPEYWANVEAVDWWDFPVQQPFSIPNRKGVLSHPAWLIAHSTNFHSDPIRRGRWVREKLLAGRVPDVPITVDAQVPEDPHRTFRERVEEVTGPEECWKCHKYMNHLGLPFEAYDDFGRFRIEEVLEHPDNLIKSGNGKTSFDVYPTKPIEFHGILDSTGDPALDGPVDDALEMIDKLAQSDRVRQSIIRHAFRFYMGRNEMLSDSQTLIDADRAYVESGGSFQAVIVSLLTSDSFMYRKAAPAQ